MNTKENNKLIAEFMQYDNKSVGLYDYGHTPNNEILKYHTSWDWLMPVIDMYIDKLKYHESWDKCYQEHMSKHISDAVMTCNIDEAYKVVVEFIKEYNNN
tara:strand:+ start:80 stop:379 length:300 start_codon:yes stop_codon:yes gene_type:complete